MRRLVLILVICCGLSLVGGVTFLTLRLLRESKMEPLPCTGQLEKVADLDRELRRFLVLRAGMPVDTPVAYKNLRIQVRCREGGYAIVEVMANVLAGRSLQTLAITRGQVQQVAARHLQEDAPAVATFVPADVQVDLAPVAMSLPRPEGDGEAVFDLTLAVDGAGLRWLITDVRGVVGTVPADGQPGTAPASPGAPPAATPPPAGGKEDWL